MKTQTLSLRSVAIKLLLLAMCMAWCNNIFAQRFSVKKFTVLTNDISAFVKPVYDLNGEACAVVKIAAPEDFAFSTPLGIVKRVDEVGEILLYLPKGSKKITIKHPQWGVLRDYMFQKPLESRVAYELVLNLPVIEQKIKHDTIVLTKTVTDTIKVIKQKPKLPLSTLMLFTTGVHADGPSFGIMFAMLKRFGFYVHAQTDFRSIGKTKYEVDKQGNAENGTVMPYYTSNKKHSNFMTTVGMMHRLSARFNVFYGAGYGRSATAWQLAESEGGGYVLNKGLTHKGVSGEAGVLTAFGRVSVSASAATIAGKHWMGIIGVGIKLNRKK